MTSVTPTIDGLRKAAGEIAQHGVDRQRHIRLCRQGDRRWAAGRELGEEGRVRIGIAHGQGHGVDLAIQDRLETVLLGSEIVAGVLDDEIVAVGGDGLVEVIRQHRIERIVKIRDHEAAGVVTAEANAEGTRWQLASGRGRTRGPRR